MRGLLLTALLLAGCGGHGGRSSSPAAKGGRGVLKVKWPDRNARLIPSAANSLVVTLTKADGTPVGTPQTVARPPAGTNTTSTTFSGLPYGDLRVAIEARPNADGTGVAQATGGGTMVVTEDAPGSLSVAMGSTVAALSISPTDGPLDTAASATLAASATDAQGNVVLLAAGGGSERLTWTSDATAVATVAGTGPKATVTTLKAGTANVTATLRTDDAGSVKTVAVPVTVAPTLTLSPSDARTVMTILDGGYSQLVDGLRDGRERFGPTRALRTFRWQALFPFSGIPTGATIQSGTLTASISTINIAIPHIVAAYPSATGALTTAAPTGTMSLGTVSGDVGAKTVDATAALQGSFAAGSPYAGIVVSLAVVVEGGASWTAPTLKITYSLP